MMVVLILPFAIFLTNIIINFARAQSNGNATDAFIYGCGPVKKVLRFIGEGPN